MSDATILALDSPSLRELIVRRLAHLPEIPGSDDWRYGGLTPAQRQALRQHFPAQPERAAVLIPLLDRPDGMSVLLTERASDLRRHAGQISFPGGRIEGDDADAVAAALRETEEEIGLPRDQVQIIGRLPDHLIVSGYRVTPVVGLVTRAFTPRPDPREVASVFEVPLRFVLDPRNHVRRRRRFAEQDIELTDLTFGERNIWGATAGMLLTLYRVLRDEDQ